MEAFADEAALTDGNGRLVHNGGRYQVTDIGKRIQFLINARQFFTLKTEEKILHFRDLHCRLCYGAKISRICRPVNDLCDQAFHIQHARQSIHHFASFDHTVKKFCDRRLSAVDLHGIFQRLINIFSEQSCACRRFRFIQNPKESSFLFRAAHRFAKLQISACVDVNLEIFAVLIIIQRIDITEIILLRLLCVGKKRARRKKCGIFPILELTGYRLEMIVYKRCGNRGIKARKLILIDYRL